MKRQSDAKGELRGAYLMHFLENAKRETQTEPGLASVVVRVTLAIIFMYLLVIGYQLMGVTGVVFVSLMFVFSIFIPMLHRKFVARRQKRAARKVGPHLGHETRHAS